MSDLLAAFEREQAEEQRREERLARELAREEDEHVYDSRSSGAIRPSSARPLSAASTSTNSYRAGATPTPPPSSSTEAAESALAAATSSLRDDEFELRPLLWNDLASGTHASAHAELRRLIGDDAIDANDQMDREIRTLLSIVTGQQMRMAKKRFRQMKAQQQQQQGAGSRSMSRAALPDSGTRLFLSQEIQGLLVSLRSQAVRSGVLDARESDLTRILPRPETARQRRVMESVVADAIGSIGSAPTADAHSTNNSVDASPASSRPSTGRPMTARPSTARQRSTSISASSAASLSPDTSARDVPIAAAISSFSSSLTSSETHAGAESARTALVSTLRRALVEEREALLQDIEYLHACLEIEVDHDIELEVELKQQRRQQRRAVAATATAAVNRTTPAATAPSAELEAPASVQELRDLNAQLKQAVALEEQRANTLAIMSAVAQKQQHHVTQPPPPPQQQPVVVRPVAASPSGSPFNGSSTSRSSTPLKAVRLPSAARVRPGSGSTLASTEGDSRPTSASGAAESPLASLPHDLQALMADNADLFSDAPTTRTNTRPDEKATGDHATHFGAHTRPAIPDLALGALAAAGHAKPSAHIESKEADGAFPSPLSPTIPSAATTATIPMSISSPVSSRSVASSRLPPTPTPSGSPLTMRSASKVRSRIQAAQQFDAETT